MGIFDHLGIGSEFRARQRWGSTAESWSDFWYSALGVGSSSGVTVGRLSAERMITVAACVTLIASDIAGLPLRVIRRRDDGGYDEADGHPLHDLLKYRPNEDMTSATWRETSMLHLLETGRRLTIYDRTAAGAAKSLVPVRPEDFQPVRDRGSLKFKITGMPDLLDSKRALYIPAYSWDGIHGVSPVTHFARESIGGLLSMEQFVNVFFRNGMAPTGVIQMPENMYLSSLDQKGGDGAKQAFLDALKARFGNQGPDARSPFVLQGGMEFKPYEARLVDAQFLELLDAKKLDVCGMFKVPPHKVGNHKASTSYNNTEQENLGYILHGLLPWITKDEHAMEAKLLTAQERNGGYRIKYNVTALLRGDMAARSAFYNALFNTGAFSPDDIRALEDMNPIPKGAGKKYFVPLNMVDLANIDKLAAAPVKPTNKAGRPLMIEHRTIEDDLRSIQARDRIAARYQPLLVDAMAAVVSREGTFIKAEIEKNRKLRAGRSIEQFLDDFYRGLPDWIIERVGPTMTSLGEAIQEAAAAEIGIEAGMTSEISAELRDYIRDFARQYADGDRRQLLSVLADPEAGGLEAVEKRLDEWHDGGPSGATRAEKVGFDQVTTLPSMIAAATFFAAGYGARWGIRGPSTCPYCRSLAGKVVARNQPFLQAGDHQPDPEKPAMRVKTTKYPALHQGCDCFITWGVLP